jgi:hypothetical protein
LAAARLCQSLGCETVIGGVAWERLPIDPHPGPRPASEIIDARPLAEHVLIAGPKTRTESGALFAEAHMADFLGEDTLLVDIWGAPEAIGEGLAEAARRLDADLIVGVDVGGDVLGDGSEPGLASPLCDAVMLAATAFAQADAGGGPGGLRHLRTLGGVFGPCCDGELTIDEFLDRLASLSAAGALVGAAGMSPEVTRELEEATRQVPTEASAQAIRCARGETGTALIRRGRRTVPLSPLGAITFFFDPTEAISSVARLARTVSDAGGLEEANDRLNALGLKTELDFERSLTEA